MASWKQQVASYLDEHVRVGPLTPEGRDWLLSALDPFHDTPVKAAGYPMGLGLATVVQTIEKEFTISTTLPGNWDCHVAMCNDLEQISTYFASRTAAAGATLTAVAQFARNPIGYVLGPSGTSIAPGQTATAVPGVAGGGVDLSQYTGRMVRLVSAGFEVHNTTAELYKQGSVVVYRSNDRPMLKTMDLTDAALPVPNVWPNATVLLHELLPNTVADAKRIPGSQLWEAKEGCYCVATIADVDDMEFTTKAGSFNLYTSTWPAAGGPVNAYADSLAGSYGASPSTPVPYAVSGAYFTGLSPQTTLTVTARWRIEVAPAPDDADLIVLASMIANDDPLAVEIYRRVVPHIPPGVMVKENSLGSFFKKILGVIKFVAPVIPGIGPAIRLGATALQGLIDKGSSQKAPDMTLAQMIRAPPPAAKPAGAKAGPAASKVTLKKK